MRRLAVLACLLAVPAAAGCGGEDDTTGARKAAQGYVARLGKRDGAGTCAAMTHRLQGQFIRAATRTNARFRGRTCAKVMQAALDSVAPDQLAQFASARIDHVRVDGDSGSFRYSLGAIRVDGRVAKEDGDWKVSCCMPGQ